MIYKPGTRLYSATSIAEVIVTRAAAQDVTIACHGALMLLVNEGRTVDDLPGTEVPLGKRYQHAASSLELLCVKGGRGPLTVDGDEPAMRVAKALPSSD